MPQDNDFSGIPALGDTEGLQNYIDNQTLQQAGVPVPEEQAPAQDQANQGQPAPLAGAQNPTGVTPEQFAQMQQQIQAINARLNTQQQVRPVPQAPQAQPQVQFTPNELKFIQDARARGYSDADIWSTIQNARAKQVQAGASNNMAQRMANIEEYLRSQERAQAESAFIDRLTTFGNKWGLSEQDLVTFANAALDKGVNVAVPNVDLDGVFRMVYPEQYAIRSQRMTPTNTSQIIGGRGVQEGTRTQASRVEDAYVEQYLKQTMPGYFNKK